MSRIIGVEELNQSQMRELKRRYLEILADEGILYTVLFDEPEKDEDCEGVPPDFYDRVDELVPEDLIISNYADYAFDEDEFCDNSTDID